MSLFVIDRIFLYWLRFLINVFSIYVLAFCAVLLSSSHKPPKNMAAVVFGALLPWRHNTDPNNGSKVVQLENIHWRERALAVTIYT